MSCKHEFIQEEWIVEVCKKCDKLRAQTVFEDDLAAANARIAELTENQLSPLELAKLYCKLKELEQRAEQAEVQNKRMREALGKIIAVTSKCLSHEEMKDKMKGIAKSALEEN